jgi:hypothetical protein
LLLAGSTSAGFFMERTGPVVTFVTT